MKEYNGKPLVEGLLEEIEYVYKSDKRPWVIGYSGGKDSTVVVHLVYQMTLRRVITTWQSGDWPKRNNLL